MKASTSLNIKSNKLIKIGHSSFQQQIKNIDILLSTLKILQSDSWIIIKSNFVKIQQWRDLLKYMVSTKVQYLQFNNNLLKFSSFSKRLAINKVYSRYPILKIENFISQYLYIDIKGSNNIENIQFVTFINFPKPKSLCLTNNKISRANCLKKINSVLGLTSLKLSNNYLNEFNIARLKLQKKPIQKGFIEFNSKKISTAVQDLSFIFKAQCQKLQFFIDESSQNITRKYIADMFQKRFGLGKLKIMGKL